MDNTLKTQMEYLGLLNLQHNWDRYLKEAAARKCSYHRFLSTIITDEYWRVFQKRRDARIKAAVIPDLLTMETFPFEQQPRLKKKLVMELYDSMRFINEAQVLVFIGPTGCGKSGLATAYLLHAINNEHRGRFIDFKEMIRQLHTSFADHSFHRILKRFAAIDCLLIDEVGYSILEKKQAGLFFDVIKSRHKKRCTIITSQLGFDEWESFINDHHLAAAILDRVTENCTVFNMSKCISLRKKHIVNAADKNNSQ